MVKPLSFKGEKKTKKRKHTKLEEDEPPIPADADLPTVDNDDSWVSAEEAGDLAGPIMVVLSTSPPTCIGCDANGKVFTSPIENIVDDNVSTAEPHDVRQVWIANKVAGTEFWSLKGHHGRYLTIDKFGLLSASREAISAEEQLLCTSVPDGGFTIKTQRDTFLTVDQGKIPPELRGDAKAIDANSTFHIRMQARFKPRLNATKETKAREKISRKELEHAVGRKLEDEEVRKLKRARREGNYHEAILEVRVKGKHDKFAS